MSLAWMTFPFLIRRKGRKIELFALGHGIAPAGEKAPQEIGDPAYSTLATYGIDPVIVAAVKAEGNTLDQIKGLDDEKWIVNPKDRQRAGSGY